MEVFELRPPEEEKEKEEQVEARWQSDRASWRASTLAATLLPHAPPHNQVTLVKTLRWMYHRKLYVGRMGFSWISEQCYDKSTLW